MPSVKPNEIPVGECLTKIPRQAKVKTNAYQQMGLIPVIDQGSGFIGGYIDDLELAYTGPLPVVVFGDHNRNIKFVKSRFAVGADGTQLLYPDERFDVRYFYYALRSLPLKNYGYERHFKYLKKECLRQWPLPVQRRIATILTAYDDLIENNMRRITILEEMARCIYEEWFVSFRFPGHEAVQLVGSELGVVPQGWRICQLGDEIELAYGKALKAEVREPGKVPVYGSSGVVGCHNESLVAGPGIIVGRKGNVGSVYWSDSAFYPIDTVFYVKTTVPLHFVLHNLQRQNFLNNDAAVPGLNRNQAYALPLILPSPELMEKFEKICGSLLGLARTLARKNYNLCTTRDLLLPRLISGELNVSELFKPDEVAA